MGRKACLAIGISDAPPLDYLPGAVNGAKGIADWASKSGYETELLLDSDNPVGISDVADALKKLLPDATKTDRLIVYFAGHGLAQGVYEDLWLPSEWLRTQRAIGIGMLITRLRRFGIGQLSIIADACRSLPVNADTAELVADPVLDRGPFDRNQPSIDNLKASSKYKAAYMIPGAAPDDDRCIFSGVLEEVLWGKHADAIDEMRVGDPKCITSVSLVKCLEAKVPSKAKEYNVDLVPDLDPGFRSPDDVYVVIPVQDAPAERAWPPAGATASLGPGDGATGREERGWSTKRVTSFDLPNDISFEGFERGVFPDDFEPGEDGEGIVGGPDGGGLGGGGFGGGRFGRGVAGRPTIDRYDDDDDAGPRLRRRPSQTVTQLAEDERSQIKADTQRRSARVQRILDSYAQEQAPTHFETGAGVAVTGAAVTDVVLGPRGVASNEPGPWGGWRVRSANEAYLSEPLPLLARMEDGVWIGAAVMPGFITRLAVQPSSNEQPSQNASLIFRLVEGWGPPSTDADAEKALAKLRAGMVDDEELVDLALNLRREKHVDPILGVIASYMYFSRGDIESIAQIAYFYASVGQAIPFDVALLAGLHASKASGLTAQIPAVGERKPRTELERKRKWAYRATPKGEGRVAGSFPWLRQGWQLIGDADEGLVDPRLEELTAELVGATFTTLMPAGGARLAEMLCEDG